MGAREGTTTYTYGTLGELKSVVKPDGTVIRYYQNANNQRVAKEINGTIVEKYLWKDMTTLLAVYDGSDNLVSRFEYAGGRIPYKMTTGDGTVYYLAYDHVGTLKYVFENARFLGDSFHLPQRLKVMIFQAATVWIPFTNCSGM